MPQYKLHYFNLRARAEIARYIMAFGDIPYEDIRFTFEEWPQIKPTTPFGQCPLLEVDGEMFAQSRAIFRYLAKQAGLVGKTDLENLRIDMMVECADEIVDLVATVYREKDETRKAENLKAVKETLMPETLAKLEKLLVANNGGDDYLVGNELTWADITLMNDFEWPKFIDIDCHDYDVCPKVIALVHRVQAHPKIAAWRDKRPKTDN